MNGLSLGTMQFTAVVLMTLLTFKLLVSHKRSQENSVATTARWQMAAATMILAVHFLLQLTLGLRAMGVTQSVMLNLTMLVPASYLFARAVLSLQKHGQLSLWDRWAGPLAWGVIMILLIAANIADGQPLLSDTPQRQWAEMAGALCYLLMQSYYTWRHSVALRVMHRALQDYYDRESVSILVWMQLSIVGLMLLALMVPFAIFATASWLLFLIAIAIFCRVERGGRRTGETRGTRSDGSDGQGRGAMDSQGQISQGRHHQSGGGSRDRHPALSADGMGQGKCLRVV